MNLTLTWQQIALRLALAAAASFFIGLDRDRHGKTAGMRTTMLVCLAATLAMIEANLLIGTVGKTATSFVQLDMMRLPLGILSGIGFIGAGAILRHGELVRGLTTAATLWIVTVLGLIYGAGFLRLGIASSVLVFVILWLLKALEDRIPTVRNGSLRLQFQQIDGVVPPSEEALRQQLHEAGFHITSWNVRFADARMASLECGVRWFRKGHRQPSTPESIDKLASTAGVVRLTWKS